MAFEPIGFVLERLYDLTKHETNILLVDEEEEVQSLQRELELIESYLKDIDEVERQATLNHVLQTKVQHLTQILPEIENFLDTITSRKAQSSFRFLKAIFSCAINPLIHKHHFVEEITRIRENLSDALQRPQGYQLPNNYPQFIYKRRLPTTSSIIKDEIIIGLEEDISTLVAKFVGKNEENGANSAIVGMGGSGKTTLAKLFYNHNEIVEAFPRRAWVCVSREWNAQDLLLQICAMLGIKLSKDERLIANVKLQEFLEESNPCLVVLDDVWERNALQELLPTLLSGYGRVLITTRNERIVRFPRTRVFYIHRARRLTPKESWEIFSQVVCNSCGGIINLKEEEDFVKLGREMLEKCDGLPLAIITLAGILGTKGTIQQWGNIKDDMVSRIMGDGNEAVREVLELSYIDLPYYLKPCFLYLGTFKEDEDIEADLLINLWIDEGFVKPDQCPESKRLKEVAKNFLDEFVQRCMVQASRDYAGDAKCVRIHDLMRDLCIEKAKKLGFFQVLSSSTTSSTQIQPPYHRAIIHNRESFVLDNSRLRTLICINDDIIRHCLPKQLVPFDMLKQVRILYLEALDLGDSIEQIGNMVLLRYLRLSQCRFTTEKSDFPKNLRNLQTFIFHGRLKLSDNMFGNMEQLRVLSLLGIIQRRANPETLLGVDKLLNLQSLEAPPYECIVKELHSTDLRELKIREIYSQRQLDAIYGCINNVLASLETLVLLLHTGYGLEFDLQNMKLERCQHLKFLSLRGKIIKQRRPWLFPPKLLSLSLMGTQVEEEEDMSGVIAQLGHLRELILGEESYKGDRLTMIGLPRLQKLQLYSLSSLKECRITQGSLPQLQELCIGFCFELERIPDGISNVKTLQLLEVSFMPTRFCKRLQTKDEGGSDGGEDFHLVQHIPTVTFKKSSF